MVKWNLVLSFLGTAFIPILYLVNLLLISQTPQSMILPIPLIIFGLLVSVLGLIFWVVSFINIGKNFGVLPQSQKKIKRGLYKYFNHPMYIGIYATFFGLSLANQSWQGLSFLNLILLPLLIIRAILEERVLIKG